MLRPFNINLQEIDFLSANQIKQSRQRYDRNSAGLFRIKIKHVIERAISYRLHLSRAESRTQGHLATSHILLFGSLDVGLQILEIFLEGLERSHFARGILPRNINRKQTDIRTGIHNDVSIRWAIEPVRISPLDPDLLHGF